MLAGDVRELVSLEVRRPCRCAARTLTTQAWLGCHGGARAGPKRGLAVLHGIPGAHKLRFMERFCVLPDLLPRRSTQTSGCKTCLTASVKMTTSCSTAQGRRVRVVDATSSAVCSSKHACRRCSDRVVLAFSGAALSCRAYETRRVEASHESPCSTQQCWRWLVLTLAQRRRSIHAGLAVCHRRAEIHSGMHGARVVVFWPRQCPCVLNPYGTGCSCSYDAARAAPHQRADQDGFAQAE